MRSLLLRLIALLLVPAVILGVQGAAVAEYGPSVNIGFTDTLDYQGSLAFGRDVTARCSATGYYSVTPFGQAVVGKIDCHYSRSADTDPTDLYNESMSLTFNGTEAIGPADACTASWSAATAAVDQTSYTSGNFGVTDCAVDEVCWTIEFDEDNWASQDPHYEGSGCQAVAMGAPPIPTTGGVCPYGTPKFIKAENKDYTADPTRHHRTISGTWRVDGFDSTVTWQAEGFSGTTGALSSWKQIYPGPGGNKTATWTGNSFAQTQAQLNTNITSDTNTVVPYGVWITVGGSGTIDGHAGTNAYRASKGLTALGTSANNGVPNYATRPEQCAFWFGPKAYNDPATDWDEPFAGLEVDLGEADDTPPDDTPPPITDGGCDFSWTDPATYMCGLLEILKEAVSALWSILGVLGDMLSSLGGILGVLGDVLDAILGIAAAILNGLLDILETAFVPDPDSWGLDELIDGLEATPPFSLLDPLYDEAVSFGASFGGGSCGTIMDVPGAELTCSDVSGSPGMAALYSLVQAGLIALTGWSMFNMVSSLFERGQ